MTRRHRLLTAAYAGWLILRAPASPAPAPPAPATPEPAPPERAEAEHPHLTHPAAPYLIGALPLLVPALVLGLFGDSAVLKTLLWRGNLVALSVALLPSLLPLIAAGVLYALLFRSRRVSYGRSAWLVLGAGALFSLVVPITFALFQLSVLAALLLFLRIRRRWLAGGVALALVVVVLSVNVTISGRAWGYSASLEALPRFAIGRLVSELPQEVVVEAGGTANAHYIVGVDDTAMTVITGAPARVRTLANAGVVARAACQYRPRLNDRSVLSFLVPAANATPYCEAVVACFEKRERGDEDAVRAALRRCADPRFAGG
ncbi:hypothetical protein [Actinoplanes sp. RD1]|uniref:hypothetical protein n=1 Tax=Actinoplanes sp. RD1 TaxID=3064538 RepID=UPI002740363D|nr:hypothetical protein [Actinoplanes sp. RD1]